MESPFKFLSTDAFQLLGSREQLTYLSDAMEELQRLKVPREARDWNSLFAHDKPSDQ